MLTNKRLCERLWSGRHLTNASRRQRHRQRLPVSDRHIRRCCLAVSPHRSSPSGASRTNARHIKRGSSSSGHPYDLPPADPPYSLSPLRFFPLFVYNFSKLSLPDVGVNGAHALKQKPNESKSPKHPRRSIERAAN